MATLADSGSTHVSESNPYALAMSNAASVPASVPRASTPGVPAPNDKSFALSAPLNGGTSARGAYPYNADPSSSPDPSGYTPATLAPASVAYEKSLKNQLPTGPISPTEINALPTPGDSVANTPEAESPAQLAAEKQAAAKDPQNIRSILEGGKTKPKLPTEQQDVNAALAPDQAQLDHLPAEYKSALASLAPYINSGQDTGNAALNAADANVAAAENSGDGAIEKALGGLGTATKEFAKSVPYQGIVQALLGQSKYQITYNNAQPGNRSDWNQSMDDIYQYLSGVNASSNGLPTPTAAASTAPGTPSTGGSGNPNG